MQKLFCDVDLNLLTSQPRDSFGPHSEHCFVAVDLSRSDVKYGEWVKDLPCPVIGVGSGPLGAFCDVALGSPKDLSRICSNIASTPLAAMILVQQLRLTELQPIQHALTSESFAYATLQKGPEFQRWLRGYQALQPAPTRQPPIETHVENGTLFITLQRPESRNAIDISMRDALCEALDLVILDNGITGVAISGKGKAFSSGGEVSEFGGAADPASAHWIRSLRLPAWRLARLRKPLTVHINGAAIGAGVEIAAFGQHVSATANAWFQLPELKYGLIPGAGGTASLPRRIGRQKTAYMALSMKRISATTALKWGLIDEIV